MHTSNHIARITLNMVIHNIMLGAQSMDLRNQRIALREAWMRALRDDPWIVRSIRGLRKSVRKVA